MSTRVRLRPWGVRRHDVEDCHGRVVCAIVCARAHSTIAPCSWCSPSSRLLRCARAISSRCARTMSSAFWRTPRSPTSDTYWWRFWRRHHGDRSGELLSGGVFREILAAFGIMTVSLRFRTRCRGPGGLPRSFLAAARDGRYLHRSVAFTRRHSRDDGFSGQVLCARHWGGRRRLAVDPNSSSSRASPAFSIICGLSWRCSPALPSTQLRFKWRPDVDSP